MKTAAEELYQWVKDRQPSAANDEIKLAIQSTMGRVMREIMENTRKREKEQMRDAFNKGVVYGMLYNSLKPADENVATGFDQFFKDTYDKEGNH